jgi:hypothetical protein
MTATLFVGHLVLTHAHRALWLRWLGTLFAPVPNRSLGMLLAGTATFYQMIGEWSLASWDVFLLLQLSFAFLIGASCAIMVYHFFGYRAERWAISYRIENSRFDTFLGNLVASVFLGASFHALPHTGGVQEGATFPLLLGIWGIVITMVSAVLVGQQPKQSRWWLFTSLLSAAGMMVVASELIRNYFPAQWIFNGREYTASQALLAVELGIVAGLLAGIVVRFYDTLAQWYVRFLLHRPFMGLPVNVSLRVFINVVVPMLPVLLVCSALLLSYQAASIYGASIALLGMLSNVGVSMVVEVNHLNADRLPVSELERRKLALVSPALDKILAALWQRLQAPKLDKA